jgi:hypothetical protein
MPAVHAARALAFFDADEEVVGTQRLGGDETQGDGRSFRRAAAGGHWLGLGSGSEGRVELACGRLVAQTLAITLGGVGDLEGDGTPCVVVVPEQSCCDHSDPAVSGYGMEEDMVIRNSVRFSINRKMPGVNGRGRSCD